MERRMNEETGTAERRAIRGPGGASSVVQRVLFRPADDIASQDLYVKLAQGRFAALDRASMTLEPYSTASTRTYFGRFPAAYFQRWTAVREVSIRATVSGRGRIRVFASDDVDRERIVGAVEVASDTGQEMEIRAAVDRFLDGGFIWVDVEAGEEHLTVSDLRFTAGAPLRDEPFSVVICTHNRVSDCLSTLSALASDRAAVGALEKVVVVDQGSDTLDSNERFASTAASLAGNLVYIKQANLGGAGGFTRGMWELMGGDPSSQADIVLMDDDIVLEPETLLRMSALAQRTIQPAIVGAQMLYLYHPNILHTSAEDANLDALRAGVPVHEDEQGIDLTEELPYRWAEGGYNAWWTCLIPREVVRTIGYPLPLFFQWDDIEYGLRARANQIPTVTLPGAAVWHADFAMKDRDDWSRYFSYRNALIVNALHGRWSSRSVVRTLARDLFEMIMSLHYGLAATTLFAVDGFLEGPDSIRSGSADVLPRIFALRADYPETVRHKPEEMLESGVFTLPAIHSGGYPRIPWLVKIKRSMWQILGFNRSVGKISSADSNWYHSSQFRRAIVTDAALDAFRIRRFDAATALRLLRASARELWRLQRQGTAAAERWRTARDSLTGRDAWDRIFRTDQTEDRDQ
jgi:galactofuranosylgalactofuranosylrhamnosyl-N-acetylglucosaminyl-diphospho-decaprenol beta-1,5/1,6-galactofuranosyltransferase